MRLDKHNGHHRQESTPHTRVAFFRVTQCAQEGTETRSAVTRAFLSLKKGIAESVKWDTCLDEVEHVAVRQFIGRPWALQSS
jgi:hypothetical protein